VHVSRPPALQPAINPLHHERPAANLTARRLAAALPAAPSVARKPGTFLIGYNIPWPPRWPGQRRRAHLAAHCAAKATAEHVLRVLRERANDINLVMKPNAPFALVERIAASWRRQLLRLEAAQQKRDADSRAADVEECARFFGDRHIRRTLRRRLAPAAEQAAAT
jgi:hypothetical protein